MIGKGFLSVLVLLFASAIHAQDGRLLVAQKGDRSPATVGILRAGTRCGIGRGRRRDRA